MASKSICQYTDQLPWIENPENKPEVDHIDTIRTNNCVNNLKWVSRIEITLKLRQNIIIK